MIRISLAVLLGYITYAILCVPLIALFELFLFFGETFETINLAIEDAIDTFIKWVHKKSGV